jgi:soluble lytic murein transglycosylase
MKLKIVYIFLSAIVVFGAGANDLSQKNLVRQISQTINSTAQKNFFKTAVCNPITLLKENKAEQALKCATKLKHKQLIKATGWLYYSASGNNASFEDIIVFVKNNPSFPDKNKLLQIAERKINAKTSNKILRSWCARNSPQTGNGAKHCLAVLTKINRGSKNRRINAHIARCVKVAWMKEAFSSQEEILFIKKYRRILSKQDHINRLNYILSKEKKLSPGALGRLNKDYRQLFEAKLRLATKKSKDMNNVLKKIAAHLKKDPYFLYLRARWHLLRNNNDRLTALLIKYSRIKETKMDQWFRIRSLLIWNLIDKGKYKEAYKIAAMHKYKDPSNYVDGEWLAGRIAFLNLKKPNLAYTHFRNIFKNSKYSISRAKGAYWTGLATEALKRVKTSKKYFKIASRYIDTFYGQLALMKLNRNKKSQYVLPALPKITKKDIRWFKNNELLIISHIFSSAHKDSPTRKFIRAALNAANTRGKKYLVAKFGKHVEIDLLSTISGKEVARRGSLFIEQSYPILEVKQEKIVVERALIHSIIRQESEFNPTAKSCAGATGLMQLMYPTAKEVGRKIKRRVTSRSLKNPKINISLGANHLNQLIQKYNGSYVLAITAYNAGEGNVNKWINERGDPRKLKKVDGVVAWIENIPFSETRSYVQYVLSNLQIYRNLLLSNQKKNLRKIHIDLKQDLIL